MRGNRKSASTFKKELTELLFLLGDGGEQRIVDALKKYKTLLERRKRNINPLSPEEQKLLTEGELRNGFLLGQKLKKLKKKYQDACKCKEVAAVCDATAVASPGFLRTTIVILIYCISCDHCSIQVALSIKNDDVSSFCSAKVSGSTITKTTTATNSSTIPSTANASGGSITDILRAMSLQAQVQRNIKNKDKLHVQVKSAGKAKSNDSVDIVSNEDKTSNLQRPPKCSRLNKINDALVVQNFKCSWPEPEKAKVNKWLANLNMIDLATFQQLQESPGNNYLHSFWLVFYYVSNATIIQTKE